MARRLRKNKCISIEKDGSAGENLPRTVFFAALTAEIQAIDGSEEL